MCSKEVLKNQSMRFNLIFKGISEDSSETLEDTSQLATDFVTENLSLPYSFDKMDIQISRAQQENDTDLLKEKKSKTKTNYCSVCKLRNCKKKW